MPATDDDDLRELLSAETIAVIGCSTTPGKAAHDIPKYLQEHGYRVVPVNPFADEILGETAYDDIQSVEPDVDLVDVFRPSEEIPGVVDDVLERKEEREDVWGLWLQLGIADDEALARADDADLLTTQDRCMKVEHGRLVV